MLVFLIALQTVLNTFIFHKLKELLFSNLEYLKGLPVSSTILYPSSTTIYILAPYQDPPQTTIVSCRVEEISATLCTPYYFASTNILGIEKDSHVITDDYKVLPLSTAPTSCMNLSHNITSYSPSAFQGISMVNTQNKTLIVNSLNPCNTTIISEYANPANNGVYTYSRIYPLLYFLYQKDKLLNFSIYSFTQQQVIYTIQLDNFIGDSTTIQLSPQEHFIFILSVSGTIIISKVSDTYKLFNKLDLRILSVSQYNDTIFFGKNLDSISLYILRLTDKVEVVDDIDLQELDIGCTLHLINESRLILIGHYGYSVYDVQYESDKTVFTMNLYFIFLIALVIVVMTVAVLIVCIKSKKNQRAANTGLTTRRPLGADQNATALPVRSDETTITEERKIVISMHQIELINKLTSCPLSGGQLDDPVVLSDGYTYERGPIEFWLKSHDVSPVTQEMLISKQLINNMSMKNYIEETKKIK